jgi:hypothetical protein
MIGILGTSVQTVKAATGTICDQYGSTTQGNYIVMNNRWGTTATQCINVTTSGFAIIQQDGVGNLGGAPVSYPAIYVGCHYSSCSPNTNLPMQISAISSANTNVTLTYPSGTHTYDAAYDIWLNADTNVSGVQDTEIMIWLTHVGSIQPIGSFVTTASLGGQTWDVWVGNNGQNNVVSYSKVGLTSFNTDVKPFLLDAITRGSGFGTTSWYLTSMQMGFEPWVNGVGLTVNSFSATISSGGGGATNTPTRTPTVTLTPIPGSNFLTNADMESGTTNWVVNGAGTLSSDTSQFHGGTHSVKTTGRTAEWNGIGQNVAVSNFPTSGQNYTVSAWVRSQTGTPTAKVTLRLTAGTTTYVSLATAAINSTGWTLVSGTVPVSWSGTLTGVLFYVETVAGTDNLYIDDASLSGNTGPTATPTRTATRTNTPTGPTLTPTRTPTPGSGGTCTPVDATITAPFTKDGTGNLCWQSSNLGTYINSWNAGTITLNGTNITNIYVASGSYPAKIGGYWYVTYVDTSGYGHIEVR